ncbi:uncharacterized protein APUU_61326S [Aspergillus puulaauensis]|uniref:Integral membrane protein n=1 Tax=Aspergillus puulaauensis TaxID=1220207 RepID=A0A7R7XWI9_9EURO|nr:uncharacterized protein APUU_61326S [Aspergillus puulaauensis]BCS28278.1 hypothetical protein APUU_61326S [Aspergillus puulaauensis]
MESVIRQTLQIYKRTHRVLHEYLWLIWLESLVNVIFSVTTRLQLDGVIPGSHAYYAGEMTLWALQTQLLSQIIANRIALIMVSRRKALQLRWGLLIAIGVVNIAVGFIWTPAHLSTASDFQVHLNLIFEYCEKAFFLLLDLSLNLYFLYLVRFRLIADGLVKYWTLYNFNIGFVVISTVMDSLLLGLLALPDKFTYVQFAPVTYTVKLYLELKMAQLISKVVRRSMNRVDSSSSPPGSSHRTPLSRSYNPRNFSKRTATTDHYDNYDREAHEMNTHISAGREGGSGRSSSRTRGHEDREGIVKTVTTVVEAESREGSEEGLRASH